MNYSQPEAYRFSHDSVFLARAVFDRVHLRIRRHWNVLDLCAGCGIVGLDFLHHCRDAGCEPARADFLELQGGAYAAHFAENVRRFGATKTQLHFRSASFTDPPDQNPLLYDLILANPPYFRIGSGKLSPSAFKNRCRFFLDGTQDELIAFVRRSLNPDGQAFLLMRDVPSGLKVAGDIRGTPLVQIDGTTSP